MICVGGTAILCLLSQSSRKEWRPGPCYRWPSLKNETSNSTSGWARRESKQCGAVACAKMPTVKTRSDEITGEGEAFNMNNPRPPINLLVLHRLLCNRYQHIGLRARPPAEAGGPASGLPLNLPPPPEDR